MTPQPGGGAMIENRTELASNWGATPSTPGVGFDHLGLYLIISA